MTFISTGLFSHAPENNQDSELQPELGLAGGSSGTGKAQLPGPHGTLFLSTCCVPSTVLSPGDTVATKRQKSLQCGTAVPVGRQQNMVIE